MADLKVERFYPEETDSDGFTGYFEVAAASRAIDQPDEEPTTVERVISRLRNPFPGFGPQLHWIALLDGQAVAVAFAYFPEAENSSLVLPVITVHPEWRRQGIGTTMLEAMLPEFHRRGRSLLEGWQLSRGGPGERWAHALGFQTAKATLMQCLVIADVDATRWEAGVPAGYRTRRWIGSAPEELLTSVARVRSAIHDAPVGESDYSSPQWTPARVREAEAELRDRNVEQRVVAAVHEASGEVVALTEVQLPPDRADWAYQQDTVVVAAHRGHGLGLGVKCEMVRWLVEDRPRLERFYTNTSADNVHMIRINHRMGYHDVQASVAVNSDIASVRAALAHRTTI
jgi:GNAT superfamily N-acetyltransferase